jgi:hypothetical protein
MIRPATRVEGASLKIQDQPKEIGGLKGIVSTPPERVPARWRDSAVTCSAWRMEIRSDRGAGSIAMVEVSPIETYFRGDGVFLGWPQKDLATVYQELLPDAPPDMEYPQLG